MTIEELTDSFIQNELESMDAAALIEWAFMNFGDKAAIGTSFQLTGSVLIDLAAAALGDEGRGHGKFRVFTVDTGRLHPETFQIIKETEERYGIKVESFKPDQKRVKDMVERFGEYLFFDDKAKQEYCCTIRKVEPNAEALKTLDVWITGLRRDQSEFRKDIKKAELIELGGGRKILRLTPLADWSLDKIWSYIKEHDAPYNTLHDKGYDSIGCVICSTPRRESEPPRAGRWRWQDQDDNKKECGIHISKKKVVA
jgi:phosphoadenylyl-sulfate reductase (thioredoxin)